MPTVRFCTLGAVLLLMPVFAAGQEAPAKTTPVVKHGPITNTSPASGKGMFENYCAVCHGRDARGDGPAASALKVAPADLTALARTAGGKYPSARVASVLRGQSELAPHGTQEMPMWGPLFLSLSQGHDEQVQMRIANLVNYIETLQAK
jgi:mono/diheme cytochrome c family protein